MNLIKDGDFVIIKSSLCLRLVELKQNKPQFFGKRKVQLYSAVGSPFGTFYEIKRDGTLSKCSNPQENEDLILKVENDVEVKDNRLLTDGGESQKLTTNDIETYKKQGISGQEMVMKIVENSSSFSEKTSFAKEKYLRKKQQKYVHLVQIIKPNIHLISEMLYMQGPLKICNLRIDTLSQMLSFCNVRYGGKYMVLETVAGLLMGAVLERLGDSGTAIQLHLGSFCIHPTDHVIKALQIPEEKLKSVLHHIDVKSAFSILNQPEINSQTNLIADSAANSKLEKLKHVQTTKDILSLKDMDSLLVAVKNHLSNVLFLIDFLAPSRPFAIFSMYLEPLVDCYVKLKSRGDILSLNITENWLRKYQVLPQRTHPDYTMSGSGGFLLTGIKVQPKPQSITVECS